MNEKIIIHCDACNGTDVLHEQITRPPQEEHLTMTEMANRPKTTITYDVYIYTHYRMVCKACGHIVKYSA
jgi:uncharacterized Zn finger protein